MAPLIALLGHSVQSQSVQSWLATLQPIEAQTIDWSDEGEVHHFLEGKTGGVAIKLSDEGNIAAIFLMSDCKDGFSQYRGDLGHGLGFSSSPEDVVRALGNASVRRAGGTGLFNERTGDVMRFDYAEHSIHFQFRADGLGIEMVTLMTAAAVPGRANAV